MEFYRGTIKSLDQIQKERRRNGFCGSCPIDPVQCFGTRRGIFGTKREPLTIPGRVYHGICLICHPHMAPDSRRQSHPDDIGDSGGSCGRDATQGARGRLSPTQLQNEHIERGYIGSHDYDDDSQEDIEMVEEEITNIMGETLTVLKPKKKKKNDRVKRHGNTISDLHEESEQEFESQQAHEQLTLGPSSYAEQELVKDYDGMDELERLVAQHFATTQIVPRFDPQSFIQGAELPIHEMEDEPSVLTSPTVFADDGTVISRSTRSLKASFNSRKTKEHEISMSAIHERTSFDSDSHSGSHVSLESHELHETKHSEEIYLKSADTLSSMSAFHERTTVDSGNHADSFRSLASHELHGPSADTPSPDIDAVIDIVRDCMQITRSLKTSYSCLKSKDDEIKMSAIHERTTTDSQISLASHELNEPTVPKKSEEIYWQSADTLSPDIDTVRDIVHYCMQMGSDEEAIEIARQALMDTESLDLALFCLTTLWVLVRKSDENKRHVLYGSKNEATRDDETPFGAIINAMVVFESAEIQTRACGVIWSLSMNPDDRKDVAQLGGCQAILQAMLVHPDNEALQVMALGALKVLSFNVVGQSSLRQISASSVVVASMAKHIINPIIQSEGCAIICNLASGPHNFIIPVTEEEVDAIVNSIMSHPESPSIQEGAIFALMSLSSSTVNVEIMRQHPNLYEALDLSFSNHPDVVGRDIQVLLENLKAEKPR